MAPPPVTAASAPAAAEALGAQMADTAARIRAAAAGVEEANPLFTLAELRAAVKRGETVTLEQMEKAEKRHAMAKLLRVLPLGAIAAVCDAHVDELAAMEAERLGGSSLRYARASRAVDARNYQRLPERVDEVYGLPRPPRRPA